MKIFRNIAKKWYVNLLFGVITISYTTSCRNSEVSPTVASSYSGEELFRGIFLLEGAIAKKIDTYSSYLLVMEKNFKDHPERRAELKKYNDQLLLTVKNLNPEYFDDLKNAVDSRNFNRIDAALESGALLLKTALYQNLDLTSKNKGLIDAVQSIDISQYDFTNQKDVENYLDKITATAEKYAAKNNDLRGNKSTAVTVALVAAVVVAAVVWEVAVVINVVAAINIGAGVFAVTKVVGPDITERASAKSQFEREHFIKQLALDI